MNRIFVVVFGLTCTGLFGCASQSVRTARTFTPHHLQRQIASAGESPNSLVAIANNKNNKIGPNTHILICQLPGSNVSFSFRYINEYLLGDDNVELGITGLAYTTDEDFNGSGYDFQKDQYRIISNLSSGLITGPSYRSSSKGLTVDFGKNNNDDSWDDVMRKPWYNVHIKNATVEFVRSGGSKSTPTFSKITVLANYNKLSSENQIGDDVTQQLTFTKDNCVGNLGQLAAYDFFTN